MGMIQINNVQYYYEQQGEGDPIVLIAGYSCDHTFWDHIVEELAKRFCVVTFDNRAVGQTRDNGRAFTLEMMANETIELIQTLGITHTALLGQSMGGIIAQIVAKKEPVLVSKLILLNSALSINARTKMALKIFIKLLQECAPIETVIEASMPWFFSPRFLGDEKNIRLFKARLMSNPYPQTLNDLERQWQALMQFDHKHERIAVPTLVVSADDDIICPLQEVIGLKEYIPQAKFSMISGGHSSPLENPIEVINTIVPFLA